ncbi:MAG: hypothetical protein U0441_05885 [Polyangiaceae bacterium]
MQPNALAKSFFVGADLAGSKDDPEFYFQTTLIDVGYGAAQDGLFTSTYAQPLSRIKWQITEDLLIARITYERVADSDGKGAGPASNDGVVAAAYPILSHFDIRRDYNPATGEESNVIVENTSDRPWNLREYIRVDWSKNMATDAYDFDTLSLVGLYGGVSYEPLSYYVNDPKDSNAPHFDPDMGYFDVTNKAFAKPGLVNLSSFGWGIDTFPSCYLDADIAGGTAPSGSCDPVELTLRQSFRKIEKTDFEPREYDGYRFQAYGGFYEDRYGYARDYGMVDQKWHRMLDHYNIWERSHFYSDPDAMTGEIKCYTPTTTPYGADPNRDVVKADGSAGADGTADECQAAGPGSQCDTFTQKCTLPYVQRKQKPIVWYYTDGSNQEFFEGTEWAAHEWDVAMRSAGVTAKYAECVRVGGVDCAGQFPVLRSQQSSNWDAVQLAKEVDDCRHKKTVDGKVVYAGVKCETVADTVGAARGYEPEVIWLAKQPEALVFCHSPVEANDPEACAPADKRLPADLTAAACADAKKAGTDQDTIDKCDAALNVRIGDLRYNQVNSIIEPQTPSPWGIMVDSEDPLTGEKVASSINVWTHVNDLFSQGVVDMARYIKGEIKTDEITEGTYIKDWSAAATAAGQRPMAGQFSKRDVRARIAAAAGKEYDAKTMGDDEMSAVSEQTKAKIRDLFLKTRSAVREEVGQASANAPLHAARLKALEGTDIETELLTKAMQQYAGIDGMPMTDAVLNMGSPVRGANRALNRQFERFKQEALGKRGACIMSADDAMSPAPLAIANLADVLEDKFGKFDPSEDKNKQVERAERMRKFIAQRAQYAVIIHEMGHSIALRHNFVSSSDAYNFRPQYWQLRTKDNTISNKFCKDLSTDGEDCVGPRYYDPITENERKNLLWMFMQSSVMDYAGETTQELIGLGAYDFAAARMFYGDAVAVYQDPSYNVGTARGRGVIEKTDNFGGLLGWDPSIGNPKGTASSSLVNGYAQFQDKYELIKDCVQVDPAAFKPAAWDEAKYGTFHPVLDGLIVSVNGQYTKCKQQPVDYAQWRSLRMPVMADTGEASPYYRGGPAVDMQNRTRVPYGFATDRWADLGNSAVYRHDNGADLYELFDFFISQQELNHVFDNYRRGRQSFSIRNAVNRRLERYNEKMRDSAKGVGLLVNIYKDFGIEVGLSQADVVDQALVQVFPTNTLASGIAFDHLSRMMARPEPGNYYDAPDEPGVLRSADLFYSNLASGTPAFVMHNGARGLWGNVSWGGELIENKLAANTGEYDSEYTVNAGSYYHKMWATMLLTESEDNFISDSAMDFLDARYRSISIADVFTEGYRRWLANNLTGDTLIKGVKIAAKANGKPDVDADGFSNQPIGTTSWWPKAGPEVCFPNVDSTVCSQYGKSGSSFGPAAIPNVATVDPLIGWEQQKFLIAWTYVFLPENQKRYWLDRLELKELGKDSNPDWQAWTELHLPSGSTYVARTFGTETIFGETVQKGISARVLQYANKLMSQAFAGKWYDKNGEIADQANPNPNDWFIADVDGDGLPSIVDDAAAEKLERYKSVPWFLARMDNWIHVGAKALYPEAL